MFVCILNCSNNKLLGVSQRYEVSAGYEMGDPRSIWKLEFSKQSPTNVRVMSPIPFNQYSNKITVLIYQYGKYEKYEKYEKCLETLNDCYYWQFVSLDDTPTYVIQHTHKGVLLGIDKDTRPQIFGAALDSTKWRVISPITLKPIKLN